MPTLIVTQGYRKYLFDHKLGMYLDKGHYHITWISKCHEDFLTFRVHMRSLKFAMSFFLLLNLRDLGAFQWHISMSNIHLIIAKLFYHMDKGHYHNSSMFHADFNTFGLKTSSLKFAMFSPTAFEGCFEGMDKIRLLEDSIKWIPYSMCIAWEGSIFSLCHVWFWLL